MNTKSILITAQLKTVINEFLGMELIPACAIGNELTYLDGNLIVKTFGNDNVHGWRKLEMNGEVTNIITEYFTSN